MLGGEFVKRGCRPVVLSWKLRGNTKIVPGFSVNSSPACPLTRSCSRTTFSPKRTMEWRSDGTPPCGFKITTSISANINMYYSHRPSLAGGRGVGVRGEVTKASHKIKFPSGSRGSGGEFASYRPGSIFELGGLDHVMGIDDELLRGALVEILVALRSFVE